MNNTSQKVEGLIRTAVQALWVSLIVVLTPLLSGLGIEDEITGLEQPITAAIVAILFGVFWWVLTTAQQTAFVQDNVVLAWAVAILMGGTKPPTYVATEIVDAV